MTITETKNSEPVCIQQEILLQKNECLWKRMTQFMFDTWFNLRSSPLLLLLYIFTITSDTIKRRLIWCYDGHISIFVMKIVINNQAIKSIKRHLLQSLLWEDRERGEEQWDGQQQRSWELSGSREDEAGPVRGDLALDPGLVLGYSGIAWWDVGQPTACCTHKNRHSTLNPNIAVFPHQRAASIPLHRDTTFSCISSKQRGEITNYI